MAYISLTIFHSPECNLWPPRTLRESGKCSLTLGPEGKGICIWETDGTGAATDATPFDHMATRVLCAKGCRYTQSVTPELSSINEGRACTQARVGGPGRYEGKDCPLTHLLGSAAGLALPMNSPWA